MNWGQKLGACRRDGHGLAESPLSPLGVKPVLWEVLRDMLPTRHLGSLPTSPVYLVPSVSLTRPCVTSPLLHGQPALRAHRLPNTQALGAWAVTRTGGQRPAQHGRARHTHLPPWAAPLAVRAALAAYFSHTPGGAHCPMPQVGRRCLTRIYWDAAHKTRSPGNEEGGVSPDHTPQEEPGWLAGAECGVCPVPTGPSWDAEQGSSQGSSEQ